MLATSYQLDFLDRGHAPQEDGEALHGLTHTWTLDASYGITSWLTAGAVLPFLLKTQQVRDGAGERSRATGGIGDPLLLLKLTFWGHRELRPGALRLGLLGGVKIPLGDDEDTDRGGVALPASFQVSSGAADVLAGGYYSVGPFAKATLYGSAVARITTTNGQGYRFGPTFSGTSDLRVAHLWPLTLAAGLRVSGAAADRAGGAEIPASGGWQLAGHLGVAFFLRDELFLNLDAVVPFWRGLHGHQMASRASLIAGVSAVF